ncbi:Os04g0129050, partial [Oryza sativa Japonica Group]
YLEPLGHIAAVAGGEDDGVEGDDAAVGELGEAPAEAGDAGDDGDLAGADPGEGAVVEHRGAAGGVLELERAGGGAADAELGEVAEDEPGEEDEDLVDEPEREPR